MEPEFWNQRYGGDEYFYGTSPNAFIAESVSLIPTGPVLCLAEGEGRNAVFLAAHGYTVTAMDQSTAGLAKARRLASSRGVTINTVTADLSEFVITPKAWSGIVATFVHLPQLLRREVHRRVVEGLQPGGVYLLEAYTPEQVKYKTGGPVNQPELLMQLKDLRTELAGLELVIAHERVRDVNEEPGHRGLSAVVQVAARKRR